MKKDRFEIPYSIAAITIVLFAGIASAQSPRRLTTDGRIKTDPFFIAGGKEIIYTVQDKPIQFGLYRLTLAGGMSEPLDASATGSQVAASFSSDDSVFAFVENNGNLHVKVVIQDRAAQRKCEYDPGGGFAGVRYLSVAPSGKNVLFAFPEADGSQHIYSLQNNCEGKRPLTAGDSFDTAARYSPDGKSIAFSSSRDGNFDIYVMTADGENVRRITDHASLDTHPAWSPDGKQLVFTSLRDGNYELYVMRADGSDVRRLTQNDERDDFAWWHPDGKSIVAVCERAGKHDLYLVPLP